MKSNLDIWGEFLKNDNEIRELKKKKNLTKEELTKIYVFEKCLN